MRKKALKYTVPPAGLSEDPFGVPDKYYRPNDDDVCEALIRALEDPDWAIRRAAMRGLVSLNDMYASTPIFGTLHQGSPHARKAAAGVLAAIGRGSSLVVEHLSQAMSDPDESVRAAVANGLAAILGGR